MSRIEKKILVIKNTNTSSVCIQIWSQSCNGSWRRYDGVLVKKKDVFVR